VFYVSHSLFVPETSFIVSGDLIGRYSFLHNLAV
jgi:hypothetical protein